MSQPSHWNIEQTPTANSKWRRVNSLSTDCRSDNTKSTCIKSIGVCNEGYILLSKKGVMCKIAEHKLILPGAKTKTLIAQSTYKNRSLN